MMIRVGTPFAFHLRGVSVHFGPLPALRDVDLDIEAGEAVGLVGPSGSGKSTLLRVLNGMVRPSGGTVRINGEDVGGLSRSALRRVRAAIGFVHQDLSLIPNVRVSRNVLAGRLGSQGMLASLAHLVRPPRTDLGEAYGILERVGIPEKLFERTDRLSGGQQQRVAVARALYQRPCALLADEPVSSVDPARARDTVDLLASISREEGLTLCMSLHNLELAREYFPRLVGLRAGRIVFDRKSEEIGDAEFHQLYDLEAEELLADGA